MEKPFVHISYFSSFNFELFYNYINLFRFYSTVNLGFRTVKIEFPPVTFQFFIYFYNVQVGKVLDIRFQAIDMDPCYMSGLSICLLKHENPV